MVVAGTVHLDLGITSRSARRKQNLSKTYVRQYLLRLHLTGTHRSEFSDLSQAVIRQKSIQRVLWATICSVARAKIRQDPPRSAKIRVPLLTDAHTASNAAARVLGVHRNKSQGMFDTQFGTSLVICCGGLCAQIAHLRQIRELVAQAVTHNFTPAVIVSNHHGLQLRQLVPSPVLRLHGVQGHENPICRLPGGRTRRPASPSSPSIDQCPKPPPSHPSILPKFLSTRKPQPTQTRPTSALFPPPRVCHKARCLGRRSWGLRRGGMRRGR